MQPYEVGVYLLGLYRGAWCLKVNQFFFSSYILGYGDNRDTERKFTSHSLFNWEFIVGIIS